jgi:hypothetical protein
VTGKDRDGVEQRDAGPIRRGKYDDDPMGVERSDDQRLALNKEAGADLALDLGIVEGLKLKTTSAAVNGVPSEKSTSSRSMSVQVRPSGELVHSRANRGSSWPVARFSLMSVACIRRASPSWVESATTNLLYVLGSYL